jgi:hypothetical protein
MKYFIDDRSISTCGSGWVCGCGCGYGCQRGWGRGRGVRAFPLGSSERGTAESLYICLFVGILLDVPYRQGVSSVLNSKGDAGHLRLHNIQ